MTSTPAEPDPEKNAVTVGLTFDANHPIPHQPHHYRARARERFRRVLLPDGIHIHVASSPEEAESLRKRLEGLGEAFDVTISGSPEHLEALRKTRSHHEERREEFRKQHPDLYEQFAIVHEELDVLSSELERATDHGVSLEAQFSKYGYSAHLRSYDDSSPSHSGSSTPRSSLHEKRKESKESEVEKGFATPLKLFKVPLVRQYFHKGLLWRASGAEEVQSFELFVDLLYVGIIAINGDATSKDPTGSSLLRFVITFTLSWKIWNDIALIVSWFETDDILQRISILFSLACLFGYTTNITQAFDSTYTQLISFYLAARLYMMAYLLLVAWLVPMIRPVMILQVSAAGIGVVLWIGSIHVNPPQQQAVIWVALGVDVLAHLNAILMRAVCVRLGPRAAAWHERTFEFYPALNIEHRTERTNAFVTLVFGYTVVALLYQNTTNAGLNAFFGKAVLGLIQAFCFNWIYFEIDGSNLLVHAIRRHKSTSFAWMMAHLPFIMAFVLAGGALSRLVVVTDCESTNIEYLTPTYQERSEPNVQPGIRWFYCAGLGVSLACMGFISISHVHKDISGLRMKKRHRLVVRFAVAIILVCLPLAEGLNSIELLGTVTALIVFVLICELWASSCCNEKLCERSTPCRYFGRCGKQDLQALVKNGEVKVEDLPDSHEAKSGIMLPH